MCEVNPEGPPIETVGAPTEFDVATKVVGPISLAPKRWQLSLGVMWGLPSVRSVTERAIYRAIYIITGSYPG